MAGTPSSSRGVAAADVLLQTLADAKGDVIGASAADTWARLAVGANDTVLTAASGETTGLKWAAAGGAQAVAVTGPFTVTYQTANLVNPADNGVLITAVPAGSFVDVAAFYSAQWTGAALGDELLIALAPSLGVFGKTIADLDIFDTGVPVNVRPEMQTLQSANAIAAPGRLRTFAVSAANVYAAAYPAGTLTGGNAIIYVITYTPA